MPISDISNMAICISSITNEDCNIEMRESRGSEDNVQEHLAPFVHHAQLTHSSMTRNNLMPVPVIPGNKVTTVPNYGPKLSHSVMEHNLFSTVPGLPENFDSGICQGKPVPEPLSDLPLASLHSSTSSAFDANIANNNSTFGFEQSSVFDSSTHHPLDIMDINSATAATTQSADFSQ
ncbi:hypothetical protein QAD02_022881 [Eretmocerus hayati]|uniref:Uncharacterized protein n=1 Tax=Eretmocerus hayati TaxID=131215 RepID=A0ACC2PXM0_9HYME|nr:hypothetical protein QAD02_022881 [Eretmocerus hayati]